MYESDSSSSNELCSDNIFFTEDTTMDVSKVFMFDDKLSFSEDSVETDVTDFDSSDDEYTFEPEWQEISGFVKCTTEFTMDEEFLGGEVDFNDPYALFRLFLTDELFDLKSKKQIDMRKAN
jgi:hypothetical protein